LCLARRVGPVRQAAARNQCSTAHSRSPVVGNRFAIEVSDIGATVDALRKAGAHFRNDIVTGVGGKQILVDDRSGNPIELFEPMVPEARLTQSAAPTR
jgi:hypothetical protein